jgi:hypothetical protein
MNRKANRPAIRNILAAVLLMAVSASGGADSAPKVTANIDPQHALKAKTLSPFELRYQLKAYGLSGEGVLKLQTTDIAGQYLLSSRTEATGLASLIRPNAAIESSRFTMDGETIRVDEYHFNSGSGDKLEDSHASFDWDAGIAHSNHQEELADVALRPGMLDRMSADLQVTLDLKAGKQPSAYTMVHRNSAKTYEFIYQGEDTVKTPAGTFKAIKYLRQRPGSSRSAFIWYAPELAYQAVKVIQLKNGKKGATLLLSSYWL